VISEETGLQGAVDASLRGTTFTLDGAAFSPAVASLLGALLPSPATSLELSGASVDTTLAEPTATGTLVTAPADMYAFLAGMVVHATFRLDGSQVPQVALAFTPQAAQAASWGVPDAIPPFGDGQLGPWTWAGAQLTVDSATPALLPPGFPSAYGLPPATPGTPPLSMSYSGTIHYTGSDAGLSWLLGAGAVAVSGPIEWWPDAPRMDVATASLTSLELDGFTLPLALHLLAVPTPGSVPDGTLAAMPAVLLAGELDRGALKIPFTILLDGTELAFVVATGDFTEASSLALDEIATLLGVSSVASQQGSGFPALEGLALRTVEIQANVPGRRLVSASATVGYTPPGGPWAPFGDDLLTFDGMSVTFSALGPLSAGILETSVDATATLAGGTLDASVTLPAVTFHCALEEGSPPIDLTKIMAAIVGDVFGDFTLLCTALDVSGDVDGESYRFQATIQDQPPWTFSAGGMRFGLSSVGFDLTHSTKTSSTDGQLVAQLIVADVPVQLAADYDGATDGWKFSGATMGTQHILLNDLVDDALELFGLGDLPASAPQVVITDLQMMLDTASYDFGFTCAGSVTMLDTEVDIEIDLGRTHDDPDDPAVVTTVFQGFLTIGSSTFEVDFTQAPGTAGLAFTWSDPTDPLEFGDIASFFGISLPEIPEGLDLALKTAGFFYDFDKHALALNVDSEHYGDLLFVSAPRPLPATTRFEVFSLDVPLGLEASKLPVAGELLPAGAEVGIPDIAVVLCADALLAADVIQANGLLAQIKAPPLLAPALAAGVTFAAKIQLGPETKTLLLPLSGGDAEDTEEVEAVGAGGLATTGAGAGAAGAGAGAHWISLDQSFGPVHFARIGVQYVDDVLFVELDASLTLGPLAVGFSGLGVGSPLKEVALKAHLDGLSIALSAGPVDISGGLLAVATLPAGVDYEYVGELTVAVKPWMLTAIGAYARVEGHPAFFLFAQVNGEFGGPPAFFVTGLMGGLGYNYALTIPAPDEVSQFPFLTGVDDPTVFGPSPTPSTVLDVLTGAGGKHAWVAPTVGSSWGAVGIVFRSFELVLGRALVIVELGDDDVEIALLGLATLSLPQSADESYVYVELQLEAVLEPEQGYFGIQASLTKSSFLLTRDCHLTGGFAFCLWFGENAHAGDFVVTIGGYHPAFSVPAWYPQVQQVGFNWAVGGGVNVSGGAYFALTPAAAMAGIDLAATYESGNLKAWFLAWANALITWKPFYVDVQIGISVGASYRLDLLFTTVTLSVELGAQLEVWGPPTGGTVHVDWYIISFTIGFGADRVDPSQQTLVWSEFETLLPAGRPAAAAADGPPPRAVLAASVQRGLTHHDDATGDWTVRGDQLVFSALSAVPASAVLVSLSENTTAPLVDTLTPAGIEVRPLNGPAATSTLTLTVTHLDDGELQDLRTWAPVPVDRALPSTLWGAPLHGAKPDSDERPIALTSGVTLAAPRATLGATPGAVDMTKLTEALLPGPGLFDATAQAAQLAAPAPSEGSIGVIAATFAAANLQTISTAQSSLVTALADFDAAPPTSAVTARLGAAAGSSFAQPPMIVAA
jgi:hypothetical protein